jgi:hypothetical protein
MKTTDDERFGAGPPDLRAAHDRSSHHRAEVLASGTCGCFYCGATFAPDEIVEWIDYAEEPPGQTAICPRCGIDSVIGDRSGVDLSPDFLGRMHDYWFA